MTTFYRFDQHTANCPKLAWLCSQNHPFFLFLALLLGTVSPLQAQTYPANFSQVPVATGLTSPTAMAFAPDGRIFVTQQGGALRVIKNGSLLTPPFVKLTVDSTGERGLLGLAFDPNFASNHFIYLYYTVPAPQLHNRISRFTANGDVVSPGSETAILDLDPLGNASNHNGGAMTFGKDGKLYIGVGENATPANSQTLENYLGKVLRINADGSAPADNPFPSGSASQRRIWAYGLRNPYTIAVHPISGKIFVNDVGQNDWEEINDATTAGLNFGWPTVEGTSSNPLYANPVFAYPHGTGDGKGCAITGGTFFNPSSTNYPASFIGKYFYQDFCNNWINVLDLSTNPASRAPFATNLSGNSLSILTGPDGNLYFLSIAAGALFKIIYTAPSPNAFAITNVTMVNCATIAAGQRRVSFSPQYEGINGQPVSFSVVNELSPTTNSGPYTLTLYTDNPSITLKAVQTGSVGEASFPYNWLAACSGGSTPNSPPTAGTPIPPQSATVGQNFSFLIPTNAFNDAETPSALTYSVSGLPAGLNFVGPATISGIPSTSGVATVIVKATDPGSLTASSSFTLIVNPGATPNPGSFAITGVTMVNCATITAGQRSVRINPQYSGQTGQPISFSIANELSPTTSLGPYTVTLFTDNPTITLKAVQSGTAGEASFTYNWLSFCTSGSPRLGVELPSALTLTVLGNPVLSETVQVDIRGASGQPLRLQTLDSQGRSLYNTTIEEAAPTERATLQLGKPSGIYFLQANTPTQKQVIKLVKP
jgi:glucose/arabinose dehydrogenase